MLYISYSVARSRARHTAAGLAGYSRRRYENYNGIRQEVKGGRMNEIFLIPEHDLSTRHFAALRSNFSRVVLCNP